MPGSGIGGAPPPDVVLARKSIEGSDHLLLAEDIEFQSATVCS